MVFEDVVRLALNAIKEAIDEDMTEENIRIAYVRTSEENKFKICLKDEVKKYITELL